MEGQMRSKHDFPSLNSKEPDGIRPNGKPYNIIIADPHIFSRKQIRQILESEGYRIIGEADNGKQVLDILNNFDEKVDIITTELDMPEIDGYALLYELQNHSKKPNVVFICEDLPKNILKDLMQMGATDFILKPIQRIKLLDRIKMATQK